MEWLSSIEHPYLWLALGLFLVAAEMLVPGLFLFWLGVAALITGVLAWALPIGVPIQIMIFAGLSIVTVFFGRNYLRRNPVEPLDPKMNKRGDRMAGEMAVVVRAIEGGTGRVKHGDSEWLARGPDLEAGARVRITGSDGAILIVEPE